MKADLLLAISECSRQEAIKWLGFPPERSINISAAADPRFCMRNIAGEAEKRLRQHYGLDHEFIMYGGGVEYRKNVENLISAYALLPQSVRRRHQLAVVCSVQPEERLRLSKRGRKAGLSTNELIFTGFVPEDHLVALYNICAEHSSFHHCTKGLVCPRWRQCRADLRLLPQIVPLCPK